MGRKKLYTDGYRICSKCNNEESTEHPFLPTGNQCKSCLQEYNTLYIRNKRGSKPRSRMSPDERRQAQAESRKRQRVANEKNKKQPLTLEQQEQLRIKRLLAEAEEYRDY